MPSRRELILAAGAALVLAPLVSCGEADEALPAGAIRVPLAELPDGVRVATMRGDEPVELIRRGDAVTARSLLCTHFGCVLSWQETSGRYICPCHAGAFDAAGTPVEGPPKDAMRVLPVRLQNGFVIVLPRPLG